MAFRYRRRMNETEDFPALGEKPTSAVPPNQLQSQQNLGHNQVHSSLQNLPQPLPQTPIQQVLFSPADKFGLPGLLQIISCDPSSDLYLLSMGMQLSGSKGLGLDVAGTTALHSTFVSPFSTTNDLDSQLLMPDFKLPQCYNVQPPPPAQSKIDKFTDETLFFMFYSSPRDIIQEVAASELYNRNWRYHKELGMWLTKENGVEPIQKTPQWERGTYMFFDPSTWEKTHRDFKLVYETLETPRAFTFEKLHIVSLPDRRMRGYHHISITTDLTALDSHRIMPMSWKLSF